MIPIKQLQSLEFMQQFTVSLVFWLLKKRDYINVVWRTTLADFYSLQKTPALPDLLRGGTLENLPQTSYRITL